MNTRAETTPVFALNGGRFHTVRNPVSLPSVAVPVEPSEHLLTLVEAAAVVPLSAKTLYRVAQRGEGPFHKVEGRWMVYENELHEWVRSHHARTAERPPHRRRRRSRPPAARSLAAVLAEDAA